MFLLKYRTQLEPAAPRSRLKHSTTEPLRSLYMEGNRALKIIGRKDIGKRR